MGFPQILTPKFLP